jgi:hypothetical protein
MVAPALLFGSAISPFVDLKRALKNVELSCKCEKAAAKLQPRDVQKNLLE